MRLPSTSSMADKDEDEVEDEADEDEKEEGEEKAAAVSLGDVPNPNQKVGTRVCGDGGGVAAFDRSTSDTIVVPETLRMRCVYIVYMAWGRSNLQMLYTACVKVRLHPPPGSSNPV